MTEGQTIQHPAHGLIQISRIQGDTGPMFGSSVNGQNLIRIRVSRAITRVEYARMWHIHDGMPLIEIDLTPIQFAETITTLNHGAGIPCTIRHLGGQDVPAPELLCQRQMHEDNFKANMRGMADHVLKERNAIREILAKKSINNSDREKIQWFIDKVEQEIADNIPYFERTFSEAADRMVAEAKAEVDAFVTHAVTKAGMEALANKAPKIEKIP